MQYMLLIYNNEEQKLSPAEQGQLMQEYMTFTQDIVKSGKFKAGDPLEPASTATTVRVRNNKTLATDGPFAETKEQLGGYYLVEAKDLDELPATLADRSIEIKLKRKTTSEQVQRFDCHARGALGEVPSKIARWALDNRATVQGAEPLLPGALDAAPRQGDCYPLY